MSEDLHISSIVVTADPRRLDIVTPAILSVRGAEIAVSDPSGKMIVTLETDDEREMVEAMTAIQLLPGVASAALAYHHATDAAGAAPETTAGSLT